MRFKTEHDGIREGTKVTTPDGVGIVDAIAVANDDTVSIRVQLDGGLGWHADGGSRWFAAGIVHRTERMR